MSRIQLSVPRPTRVPWNKGRLVGQKRPLLPRQVWAIRARLELADNLRDLALFNLAIDSKLRGCDLVRLRVADLVIGGSVRERVSVMQSKTRRPVQFEVSENTRKSVLAWVNSPAMPPAGSNGREPLRRTLGLRQGDTNPANTTIRGASRRLATPMSEQRFMPLQTLCSCARWLGHRSSPGACA